MERIRARVRDDSVLARLINKVKESDNWGDLNESVENWFRRLQDDSQTMLKGDPLPPQIRGSSREYAFSQCATVLYRIRMILPTHPDYQLFIANPLIRTEADTVSRFCGPSSAFLHPNLWSIPAPSPVF